jgi:hypothetical protein
MDTSKHATTIIVSFIVEEISIWAIDLDKLAAKVEERTAQDCGPSFIDPKRQDAAGTPNSRMKIRTWTATWEQKRKI